jgi:hypothetical protein
MIIKNSKIEFRIIITELKKKHIKQLINEAVFYFLKEKKLKLNLTIIQL